MLTSMGKLLGVVLFRFSPLARAWAVLLILVNLASLAFIDTIYAQLNLAAVLIGIALMIAIHMRLGFVRLLGIGHLLWIPMLVWFAFNLPDQTRNWLFGWVVALMVVNAISLVIDGIDVFRWLRGERTPHYVW